MNSISLSTRKRKPVRSASIQIVMMLTMLPRPRLTTTSTWRITRRTFICGLRNRVLRWYFFYIHLNCTLIIGLQADAGVVNRNADQESGQGSTTAGQASLTTTKVKSSKRPRYRNHDLPIELTAGRTWTKEIIPALFAWAGSLVDPWTISDDELVRSLRIIILTTTPDFKELDDIRPGTAIFDIVLLLALFAWPFDSFFLGQACQRLCHWRGNFGSTAVALVAHFLVSDKRIGVPSPGQVRQLCSDLVHELEFVYSTPDRQKFHSHFVLYLLGHAHLRPCADSPNIPELGVGDQKNVGIKGALALTCAVVRIAFFC